MGLRTVGRPEMSDAAGPGGSMEWEYDCRGAGSPLIAEPAMGAEVPLTCEPPLSPGPPLTSEWAEIAGTAES
jgi:hypothetical protein